MKNKSNTWPNNLLIDIAKRSRKCIRLNVEEKYVIRALDVLHGRRKELMLKFYKEGITVKEIAKEFNIVTANVNMQRRQSLDILSSEQNLAIITSGETLEEFHSKVREELSKIRLDLLSEFDISYIKNLAAKGSNNDKEILSLLGLDEKLDIMDCHITVLGIRRVLQHILMRNNIKCIRDLFSMSAHRLASMNGVGIKYATELKTLMLFYNIPLIEFVDTDKMSTVNYDKELRKLLMTKEI